VDASGKLLLPAASTRRAVWNLRWPDGFIGMIINRDQGLSRLRRDDHGASTLRLRSNFPTLGRGRVDKWKKIAEKAAVDSPPTLT